MSSPEVSTSLGRLRGSIHAEGVLRFAGIPYATPPTGRRRFAAPEAPEAWSGVRDATQFGPIAWQSPGPLNGRPGIDQPPCDEDCLTLNVYTPACDDAARPVMVWIHGGGFSTGSSAIAWYDGRSFVQRGDVVVVTVNYRLGPLGFLHLDGLDGSDPYPTAGRNGLLDQVAALRWVRYHIDRFGGDPANVTVFGESAGGMSVTCLLAIPEAEGLLHKAIAQSGAAHNVLTPELASTVTRAFLDEVGVHDVEGLLAAEPADLLAGQEKLLAAVRANPGHLAGRDGARGDGAGTDGAGAASMALAMPFQPVLQSAPLDAIRAGSAAGVPLITGTTADEWNLFNLLSPGAMDDPKLLRRLDRMVGDALSGGGRTVADTYRAARPEAGVDELWCAVLTDWVFRIPAIRLAEAQLAHQPTGTWLYRFSWASRAFDGALGACHALEVPFVWNTLDAPGARFFLGNGPKPTAVAEPVHDAWWRFARTGDPNHPGLPEWPCYDLDRRATLDMDERFQVLDDPGGAERELWNDLR